MTTRTQVPAIEGWFTTDTDKPALLGSKCTSCGTYAFPKATTFCANPHCQGTEFAEVELSRTGTVWSYTNAGYQPPPPYIPVSDKHQPFAIAAVELADEGMVVMGQVVAHVDVDDLKVGDEMELVLDTLYSDDDHDYLIWKWAPTGGAK